MRGSRMAVVLAGIAAALSPRFDHRAAMAGMSFGGGSKPHPKRTTSVAAMKRAARKRRRAK